MSDTYLEEVKSALNKDQTRLGDVWRLSKKGLSAKQIAEELNVKTHGFVYNAQRYIKAIVGGSVPTAKGRAKACGRYLRGFADRHRDSLSSETISKLREKADECDRSAADSIAAEKEKAAPTRKDEASTRAQKAWKTRRQKQQAEVKADEPSAEKDESPTDESADWRDDLLDTLQNMPPDAFERLCQRLLRESGFIEVEVTGRSGDGGIDGYGIIRLAGMISFPVLFQCKRYSGNVGPNVVRDFRGAMAGRAEKGVILTTGGFTRDAQREATRDGATPIDLIDGQLLMDKMKELKLGLHTKMVEVVQVDRSWFASFSR